VTLVQPDRLQNSLDGCNINLHLEQIRHLFQLPELDPFVGHNHTLSGIEEILNELRSRSSNCQNCYLSGGSIAEINAFASEFRR
jgi:hypothetical protein